MSELAEQLSRLLPSERVSVRQADLAAASHDESALPACLPDVVAWPLSTEEVARVLSWAHESRTSVTARGAGSSLEGNPIPLAGGVVLDLSRMDRVGEIRAADLQVDVEPGVVYDQLNRQLRPHGLFFPPSPGGSADVATIGGMIANNASGIYSVRYGGTREHVRALTVVTGTGAVVRLGNRCRKHSSGYHLVGLLAGSEGTLGIVTEATLAVAGLPAARRSWSFAFPDDRAATGTIADLLRYGVDVAAAEFLDRSTVAAVNRFRSLELEESPTLLLEVHGAGAVLGEAAPVVEAFADEHGGRVLVLPASCDPWREIRHYTTRAIQALDPQAGVVRADLAVPISALPDLVATCAAVGKRRDCRVYLFGHAGIGILHVLVPARPETRCWGAALAAKDDLVRTVIELGGAVSGEHGMGVGNRRYAVRALGPALDLMKGLKAVFDPRGILNPRKIWE